MSFRNPICVASQKWTQIGSILNGSRFRSNKGISGLPPPRRSWNRYWCTGLVVRGRRGGETKTGY